MVPTQGPIPENFHEKIFRIGLVEKLSFFESAILDFFSHIFQFVFASFLLKSITN